jgi:hypothetical protein
LYKIKKFAQDRGLVIQWQHLHGPAELDPRNYGNDVAALAVKEIQLVYDNFDVNQQEQDLFESALATYNAKDQTDAIQLDKLKTFVNNIENKYHPDTAGKFAKLWPEFGELLWPQKQY